MPKKATFQLSQRHRTSLGKIVHQTNTVVVFGKLIDDLPPTPQGHRFAQVFGHKTNGVCTKLQSPVMFALPDPDGRADDCGWDPDEFVRWEVSTSLAGTQMHVQTAALSSALFASAAGVTGAHPTTSQAANIVLASCLPEHPNATLNDTVGGLFPLANQRTIFASRVVGHTKDAGFKIDPGK